MERDAPSVPLLTWCVARVGAREIAPAHSTFTPVDRTGSPTPGLEAGAEPQHDASVRRWQPHRDLSRRQASVAPPRPPPLVFPEGRR